MKGAVARGEQGPRLSVPRGHRERLDGIRIFPGRQVSWPCARHWGGVWGWWARLRTARVVAGRLMDVFWNGGLDPCVVGDLASSSRRGIDLLQ